MKREPEISIKYKRIFERFPKRTILVLGDLMVDEYIWGSVSRISPEAPVPVVEVRSESLCLGGAANVTSNIRSLGGKVLIAGLTGDDAIAEWLVESLEDLEVPTEGVLVDKTRPTTIKTRVIAGSQQVVRFDRESIEDISPYLADFLVNFVRKNLHQVDALLISDYGKGVITREVLGEVIPLALGAGKVVTVDPKVTHFPLYRKVTAITPNQYEAAAAAGKSIRSQEELIMVGSRLLKELEVEALLITKGEQGMSLFQGDGRVSHIPARAKEVYDVTGAGDTVISALTLALTAGATMEEGAHISNYAAGVVVGKVGTATVSLEELRRAMVERGKRKK